MTDDPSSPSKKLVRETRSNLCTQDTQESHTRNMASDDSEEDALAVFLMVTALEESKKVKKTKAMHMVTWFQPWLQNRPTLGAYHALLQELQCSDQKSLRNFLRMDVESFAQLIQKVSPLITRQETSMRLILL